MNKQDLFRINDTPSDVLNLFRAFYMLAIWGPKHVPDELKKVIGYDTIAQITGAPDLAIRIEAAHAAHGMLEVVNKEATGRGMPEVPLLFGFALERMASLYPGGTPMFQVMPESSVDKADLEDIPILGDPPPNTTIN